MKRKREENAGWVRLIRRIRLLMKLAVQLGALFMFRHNVNANCNNHYL